MAKGKKRLNKTAKAAQKILEESKLLASTKTAGNLRTDEPFKPSDTMPKPSTANKLRPEKKRG
jgi:hypothetical protein